MAEYVMKGCDQVEAPHTNPLPAILIPIFAIDREGAREAHHDARETPCLQGQGAKEGNSRHSREASCSRKEEGCAILC